MKYCMRCGVEIDEIKNRVCPLCNTIILKDEEIDSLNVGTVKAEEKHRNDNIERNIKESKGYMGLAAFIICISSLGVMLVLFLIDFAIGFNIDWSRIPNLSIMLITLSVCIPLVHKKSFYWNVTYNTILLGAYFFTLNIIINGKITWSYYVITSLILMWVYLSSIFSHRIKGFIMKIIVDSVATTIFVFLVSRGIDDKTLFARLVLPINAMTFLFIVISYLFIKTYTYNWRIIVTTILINISLLSLGIDLVIQKYYNDVFVLKWSYIVLIVLIPLTLFMLYLDNKYKIHQYVMKKFHI